MLLYTVRTDDGILSLGDPLGVHKVGRLKIDQGELRKSGNGHLDGGQQQLLVDDD